MAEKCERCGGGGWVPNPSHESKSWDRCECHPEVVDGRENMRRSIVVGLKDAGKAHPEIDFAGLEGSIAKRVFGAIRNGNAR